MLTESGLSKELQPYVARTAAVIRNRCYCERTGETPHFLVRNQICQKLGSLVQCVVYEQNKKKLHPKCKKGVFVGFDQYSLAYVIFFSETNKVQKYRLVHFTMKDTTD